MYNISLYLVQLISISCTIYYRKLYNLHSHLVQLTIDALGTKKVFSWDVKSSTTDANSPRKRRTWLKLHSARPVISPPRRVWVETRSGRRLGAYTVLKSGKDVLDVRFIPDAPMREEDRECRVVVASASRATSPTSAQPKHRIRPPCKRHPGRQPPRCRADIPGRNRQAAWAAGAEHEEHLAMIFTKIGAANRAEAVGIAMRKLLLKV